MGSNLAAGELLQLYVPGGWWKASKIPAEDLKGLEGEHKDRVGCLISEIVCPGWTIDQHKFLTKEKASRGGSDASHRLLMVLIAIASRHVARRVGMGRVSGLYSSGIGEGGQVDDCIM
jgi:hypothetical protein